MNTYNFIDLTGKKFGRLTVIRRAEQRCRKPKWVCKCDCGTIRIVNGSDLRGGKTQSCGCLNKDIVSKRETIDLVGQVFDRLTVLKRAGSDKHKKATWFCRCICGKECIVAGIYLLNGDTRSCGCLAKETLLRCSTVHGLTHTKLFSIWRAMKQRCRNTNNKNYRDYGGRGIKICDEWLHDFQTFYDWAMANGYHEGLSIDRVDVNGAYNPSNCRWISQKEQTNNMRKNVIFEHNGESHSMADWCRIYGIKYQTAQSRYHSGKTFEEIFNIKN